LELAREIKTRAGGTQAGGMKNRTKPNKIYPNNETINSKFFPISWGMRLLNFE